MERIRQNPTEKYADITYTTLNYPVFVPYAWGFEVDINSWHPDRSNEETKSRWCNDCPLSFIYLGNLAIHSTPVTQIW